MGKRKRSTTVAPKSQPGSQQEVLDGVAALRASLDVSDVLSLDELLPVPKGEEPDYNPDNEQDECDDFVLTKKTKKANKSTGTKTPIERALERPPPVNSDYVPIPWKGRIGYACLNTYLRTCNPPVFCSRTCRIETILKHGAWPKGLEFVQSLGFTNSKDLVKLIRWNEKYGIKFLRISSEMFPFASHKEYGYSLEFAKEPLKEAGKAAMELGHRLTTHPGQFTQLGSPRDEVIEASVRDLEYHSQLLGLLGLKGQADKDAVMILHLGGVFGDKGETLSRFRKNYTSLLSDEVKKRLVLENDDVSWSVHDLLPICEELNIPLVFDYHHHNIIHDPTIREGTLDVQKLAPRIKETWSRKGITQKQHYSEPRDEALTDRDRRKHSARVRNLPPCDDTMDLMIEAKDKEQAVFELYKKYKIGGEGLFNEIIPHERTDENKKSKKTKKKKEEEEEAPTIGVVPNDEIGMGGSERRVYWPEGKEDWLSPPKRIRKKQEAQEVEEDEAADRPAKARRRKTDNVKTAKPDLQPNKKKAARVKVKQPGQPEVKVGKVARTPIPLPALRRGRSAKQKFISTAEAPITL